MPAEGSIQNLLILNNFYWIPAFAGMTSEDFKKIFYFTKL